MCRLASARSGDVDLELAVNFSKVQSRCLRLETDFAFVFRVRIALLSFVSRLLMLLCIWLGSLSALSAHVVEQLYSEWEETDSGWRLEVQFDAGYADAETRDDQFQPPFLRSWLIEQPEEVWLELQLEAEKYLKEMVQIEANGRVLDWEVDFPDWETSPPDFPELLNGVGYFRAVIKGSVPGRIAIGVKEGNFPKLIVARDGQFLVLAPGKTKELREGERWWVWLREGYRHVVPLGWDHVLFVLGLFLYRRKIWELVHQSLAFTVAHSLTLGLAAAGLVVLPQSWSGPLEILIALSLVMVGIENLRAERRLRTRLVLVFALGLLHGLGFAGALANYVDREQLLSSIAALNIGVELAQISLLALAWILTLKWYEKPAYDKVRIAGSVGVAAAGAMWAVTRLVEQL